MDGHLARSSGGTQQILDIRPGNVDHVAGHIAQNNVVNGGNSIKRVDFPLLIQIV